MATCLDLGTSAEEKLITKSSDAAMVVTDFNSARLVNENLSCLR